MPIKYKKTVVLCEGHCEIEEADELLAWFIENPKGKINFKQLTQLHTALLQVIMAIQPQVSSWPENLHVCAWLKRMFHNTHE